MAVPPRKQPANKLIARTLAERDGVVAINSVGAGFPRPLHEALPPLPAPLEYRLTGYDLVIRDTEADAIVDLLRNAVGPGLTVIR